MKSNARCPLRRQTASQREADHLENWLDTDSQPAQAAKSMRAKVIVSLLTLMFLVGCRSSSVVDTAWTAAQDRRAYAYSAVIPLPEKTPFDATPAERTAFLSAYQDGYRSGLTQLNEIFGRPKEGFPDYQDARTQGWDADGKAGFAYALRGSSLGGTNTVQDGK